ncbi:hypothetical protein [Nonomuraea diastatica]|uniref:Uncharacterized protein n=1 Tax=Nonomuraea diastatica TaxID=1848329 RepID=A0A4R4WXU1_9ACTN|nr:hypothetical protein [Nonomuraea diastatica]TDD22561.1 hypothetical protein E1294_11190 [Nonomuraea diastatica]
MTPRTAGGHQWPATAPDGPTVLVFLTGQQRFDNTGSPGSPLEPTAAGAAPGVAAAEPAATGAWPTSCDAEAAGYRLMRVLDLPTAANWRETIPPYTFDDTAGLSGGGDRVGYCLELTTEAGTTWVWASMEALSADPGDLGLPPRMEQARHQFVDDLTVASNVPGVQQIEDGSGWVEMWPHQYDATGSGQVPGASEITRDADDAVPWANGYGSFQVHAFADAGDAGGPQAADAPAATPVLAVNAFTTAGPQTMDLGIGAGPREIPDWTSAQNAGDYTARRLTFYARPSLVRVDAAPISRQVVPRPGRTATSVSVPVSGVATDPAVTAVELRTTRDGRQTIQRATVPPAAPRFSFTVSLPVALTSTDLELVALTAGGDGNRVGRAVDVVAGDVIIVQGRSNAQKGRQPNSTSSEADRSRWVLTEVSGALQRKGRSAGTAALGGVGFGGDARGGLLTEPYVAAVPGPLLDRGLVENGGHFIGPEQEPYV